MSRAPKNPPTNSVNRSSRDDILLCGFRLVLTRVFISVTCTTTLIHRSFRSSASWRQRKIHKEVETAGSGYLSLGNMATSKRNNFQPSVVGVAKTVAFVMTVGILICLWDPTKNQSDAVGTVTNKTAESFSEAALPISLGAIRLPTTNWPLPSQQRRALKSMTYTMMGGRSTKKMSKSRKYNGSKSAMRTERAKGFIDPCVSLEDFLPSKSKSAKSKSAKMASKSMSGKGFFRMGRRQQQLDEESISYGNRVLKMSTKSGKRNSKGRMPMQKKKKKKSKSKGKSGTKSKGGNSSKGKSNIFVPVSDAEE